MINMQSDGLFYRLLVTPRRPKFQSMTLPFFLAQPRSKLISMARWCGSGRKITKQTMASAECTTSHICQGYRGDIVTSCNFMINAKSYRHNIYETIPCSCSCRSQEQVQFCGVSPHVGYFCGSMNINFSDIGIHHFFTSIFEWTFFFVGQWTSIHQEFTMVFALCSPKRSQKVRHHGEQIDMEATLPGALAVAGEGRRPVQWDVL